MQTGLAFQRETIKAKKQQIPEDVSTAFNSVFSVKVATSPKAIDEVFGVRYQVYCIDRPFEDPNCFADNREQDAYDPRSAHGLIRHRMTGDSVAAVRLIMASDDPEEEDFPMEASCIPQMDQEAQDAIANTCREQVAEISRLAVSREFRRRLNLDNSDPDSDSDPDSCNTYYIDAEKGKRAMPYIILGLFSAILQMSIKHGITHWMAVMEPAQLRLLKRFGVEFDHVGPVLDYHGRRCPAFAEAASLIEGARKRRPDVWSLVTDSGRYLPASPITDHQTDDIKIATTRI